MKLRRLPGFIPGKKTLGSRNNEPKVMKIPLENELLRRAFSKGFSTRHHQNCIGDYNALVPLAIPSGARVPRKGHENRRSIPQGCSDESEATKIRS